MEKNSRVKVNLGFIRIFWFLFGFVIVKAFCDNSLVVLFKCPDFEGTVDGELWTVPISFMSDSSERQFRLEALDKVTCEVMQDLLTITIPSEIPITTTSIPLSSEGIIEFEDINGTNITFPVNETYSISQLNSESSDAYFYQPVIRFTPRGMLFSDNEYFRRNEFCILRISETQVTVRVCEINCQDETTPCIPLCCTIEKAMEHNGSHGRCYPSGPKQFVPTFYENPYTKLSTERASKIRPHFIKTVPNCGDGTLQDISFRRNHNIQTAALRVLTNGKVKYIERERRWKDVDQYCLAGLQNFGEGHYYSGSETDQIMFTCWSESEFNTNEVTAPHYYILSFFLGSVFLFFTALVYILLWEKQNIHGWTVMSLVLSMFFMFIFLASSHLLGLIFHWNEFSGSFFCRSVGIIAHFFFLSTFCWLTVINFDLYWTFQSMTPVSGRSKGVKRFMSYLCFAWGVPAIIVSVGVALQHLFPDPESEIIVPDYGTVDCFILDTAKGVYLYYVIGILLVINLIFMCLTIYTIYKFKEGTHAVSSSRSSNSQSLSVKLFIKLFFVMGVTWCFEFISWALTTDTGVWYWIIFDLFNLFQSLGIFVIFVCKRKILNQLEQKYPSLKVITGPLRKITLARRATRTITTTSTGIDGNATRTTGFSGRNFQTSSKSKTGNSKM